jgi:ABC-2 type transport system permease protein
MACPPYAPPHHSLARTTRQYLTLLCILLAEYRRTWFFHTFFGLMLPVGFIFFLQAAGEAISTERAIFLLGGNMAASITFGPACMLASRIGWQRHNREFEYWAALPVAKLVLILAIISVALAFALPALLGVYLFGSLLLDLPFLGGLALLPLVPLGTVSLAGFGAVLGSYAKDGQTANVLANILTIFISLLSPILIPPEALPAPLRVVALFIPTTYVADAFRAVLTGAIGINLAIDVLLLMLFGVVCLEFVHQKLDWRAT